LPLAKYQSVIANQMDGGIATSYHLSVRDMLQPVICSSISKSEGVILTKFLEASPIF
jgi:hypothetical protein